MRHIQRPSPEFHTPILFLVFNRPEETRMVFSEIRRIRPKRLYLAADGPRMNQPNEPEKVALVREIASAVDWDCEVRTLFREQNMGCRDAVSSAITWFFGHEEEGIILEDDCLPSQSFFRFCEEALRKYRHDPSIMCVTGTNILPSKDLGSNHLFSKYPLMWGWATWARAWEKYDVQMNAWAHLNRAKFLEELNLGGFWFRRKWTSLFHRTYNGEIDTWDYQWIFCCWLNDGLTVAPAKNLIRNIGFSENATHTDSWHPILSNLDAAELQWPQDYPPNSKVCRELDRYITKHWFGVNFVTFTKSLLLGLPGAHLLRRYTRLRRGRGN